MLFKITFLTNPSKLGPLLCIVTRLPMLAQSLARPTKTGRFSPFSHVSTRFNSRTVLWSADRSQSLHVCEVVCEADGPLSSREAFVTARPSVETVKRVGSFCVFGMVTVYKWFSFGSPVYIFERLFSLALHKFAGSRPFVVNCHEVPVHPGLSHSFLERANDWRTSPMAPRTDVT